MKLLRPCFEVCYGTTRTVFLVWNWAVKVPSFTEWRLFLLGLLANMQERRFSDMGRPEMCPVLWSLPGGWISIMRRARPMTRMEFFQFDTEEWVKREDYMVPVEHKMSSFGWLGDQVVAVDYGN